MSIRRTIGILLAVLFVATLAVPAVSAQDFAWQNIPNLPKVTSWVTRELPLSQTKCPPGVNCGLSTFANDNYKSFTSAIQAGVVPINTDISGFLFAKRVCGKNLCNLES